MTDPLRVHLNRESVHGVEPEASHLEASGSFSIVLENHGAPAHVHVRLDDALAAVADVPTPNYYVERGSTRVVDVDVGRLEGEIEGEVEILTGYGSTGERVTVHLESPESETVRVDDRLGERSTAEEEREGPPATREAVAPTVLAASGVLVAALAVLFVPDAAAIPLGIVALLAGVGTAGYLLFWK